jgi:hypothetical protein
LPEFEIWFLVCADHLVNEFDQIKSISAFKDVHSNTGIFGIHTSTVSILFICASVTHNAIPFIWRNVVLTMVHLFDGNIRLLALVAYPFLCGYSNHVLIEHSYWS